jgi:DNA-binding PadR family transcriptional regulator
MQRVQALSEGKVELAAGTLYGALETLLKRDFIFSLPSDDPRCKVYVLSMKGKQVLYADYQRMSVMINLAKETFKKEMKCNEHILARHQSG